MDELKGVTGVLVDPHHIMLKKEDGEKLKSAFETVKQEYTKAKLERISSTNPNFRGTEAIVWFKNAPEPGKCFESLSEPYEKKEGAICRTITTTPLTMLQWVDKVCNFSTKNSFYRLTLLD